MKSEQVLKSISEGQVLIALFDGWYQDKSVNVGSDINWYHNDRSTKLTDTLFMPIPPSSFKYNKSWDWLMPVVKKWNDLVISKRQDEKGWMKWQYKTIMLRTDIEPLFKDLVESIKWYNSLERGGN